MQHSFSIIRLLRALASLDLAMNKFGGTIPVGLSLLTGIRTYPARLSLKKTHCVLIVVSCRQIFCVERQ